MKNRHTRKHSWSPKDGFTLLLIFKNFSFLSIVFYNIVLHQCFSLKNGWEVKRAANNNCHNSGQIRPQGFNPEWIQILNAVRTNKPKMTGVCSHFCVVYIIIIWVLASVIRLTGFSYFNISFFKHLFSLGFPFGLFLNAIRCFLNKIPRNQREYKPDK